MEGIDWQLSAVAILLLTGLGWGLLYDLFNIFKSKKRKEHFKDFLFWMVSMLFIIPIIFFTNWGELRIYLWISILAGICCYRLVLRSTVLIFLKMLKRKFKRRQGYF